MNERMPRVLVIDDDESFCRLIAKNLQRANFEVFSVNSGTEGLEQTKRSHFDVIILDHVLPEYDGVTLLTSLRADPKSPPVVYLTGSQDSRVAVSALKAGASEYVVKDLDAEFPILLQKAVNNAILTAATKAAKEAAEEQVRIARDEYRALAEERALLLREVNHRVSNSLQLIASLLHFQGDATKNSDVKAALKEANGRVLAVARVHRSLYTSQDVRYVALNDYLSALIEDLQDVSASNSDSSKINIKADPVQVEPDTAVAVGIITTELVLNALKHAYPHGHGPVDITLSTNNTSIELCVRDHGVGQTNNNTDSRKGLGQRIIAAMTEKLNGTITYHYAETGTHVDLKFPKSTSGN